MRLRWQRKMWWLVGMIALGSAGSGTAKPVNYGGSNHFLYAFGTTNGFGPGHAWYLPALNLRPVLGTWHHNRSLARSQMAAARASGQSVYVLPIWSAPVAACEHDRCHDKIRDGVWGHVVNYGENGLDPQQQKNLQAIITHASELGFKRMIIRFFHDDAMHKARQWDDALYAKIWGYVRHTRQLATGWRDKMGSPMELLYDLAGEFGGVALGQGQQFNTRLWHDYVATFSRDDAIGFSFAYTPGRFARQRQWYGAVLPKWWAFDLYPASADTEPDADTATAASDAMAAILGAVHVEMAELRNQPLLILETFFNDAAVSRGVQVAIGTHRLLNIDTLCQWPATYGSGRFSREIVAALSQPQTLFQHYLALLGKRAVHYTASDADLLALADGDCSDGKALPCNITLVLGKAAVGKKNAVYVSHPGQQPTLVACQGEGDVPINRIGEFARYRFDLYQVEQCPISLSGTAASGAAATVMLAL